jgi:hypothetical protein
MEQRRRLSQPARWLLTMAVVGVLRLCVPVGHAYVDDALARHLATATPTPVALELTSRPDDEAAGQRAYYDWLRAERGAHAFSDADLEGKAYYLAGEAPRLLTERSWPQWPGLRYAVGPSSGAWGRYWPGCNPCPPDAACYALPTAPKKSMATTTYPGLAEAERVGAAVAWRGETQILAVVWPGACPTPAPLPTPGQAGPTGPRW